jgi:hypothetical protein
MHRSSLFALATGAALALAACRDSSAPLATEGELAQVRPGPACNTADAKAKARSHFGQPTQNDIAGSGGLIDLLIASTTPEDSTRYGFDVLERVELGEDVVGDAQTALDLVNAILPCIQVGATSIGPKAIFESGGAFAIRGGLGDDRPVYSHNLFSAVAPPSEPVQYDTWSEWLGLPDNDFPDPRAIIYGTDFTLGNISNELEVGTRGFDWNTLPVRPYPRQADGFLGMCVGSSTSDRVQSNHPTQQGVQQSILGFYDPSQPPLELTCSGFNPDGTPKNSASLLRRAIDIVSPQPLFATVLISGTGSKPKGYSQKFVVLVSQGVLSIIQQPSTEKIGDPITPPILIQARTAASTPIENMGITIELRSNLGVPSSFQGTKTRTTNELGIATFDDIVVNSSGTYRIRAFATGGTEGMTVSEIFSDQFFIGTRSKK